MSQQAIAAVLTYGPVTSSCWQYGAGRDCYVTLPVFAASVDVRFFASRAATSASLPEPHFEMHCMTLIDRQVQSMHTAGSDDIKGPCHRRRD